jgi:hypothetical protein
MMPTFPSPSLKFRTVGFPQYGFKAGMSKGTFLDTIRVKPAPSMPHREASLSPFFACSLRRKKLGSEPKHYRRRACRHSRDSASLPQGSSAPVRVMLSHTISAYTTPCASPTGTLRFRGIALIRSAFAVRERRGDPRDLPDFHCCPFHACHRPYPGGPLRHPVVLTQRFQASSKSERVANRYIRLYQQCPTEVQFRDCIVRFMLRPACLPSPPDWLQRDEVTCASPCLLRYIVIRAFDTARYRAALRIRLNGRTGNLPLSGLTPDQLQQLVRLQPIPIPIPIAILGVVSEEAPFQWVTSSAVRAPRGWRRGRPGSQKARGAGKATSVQSTKTRAPPL